MFIWYLILLESFIQLSGIIIHEPTSPNIRFAIAEDAEGRATTQTNYGRAVLQVSHSFAHH